MKQKAEEKKSKKFSTSPVASSKWHNNEQQASRHIEILNTFFFVK